MHHNRGDPLRQQASEVLWWYSVCMYAITSFIDTLYDEIISFSVRMVHAYIYADEQHMHQVHTDVVMQTEATSAITLLPESVIYKELAAPAPVVVASPSESSSRTPLVRGMIMYAGVAKVPVFKNPTVAYDTQVGTIPFGAMVIAGEPIGRFYKATWNEVSGWVLRDDLADKASSAHPIFVKGEENLVDDSNTAQVRTIIGDEFGLGRSEFALQAGEYVLYRLWKRGVLVKWPEVRPRMPGAWHEILKGCVGVTLHTVPKAGVVMEYMLEDAMGHVAYVDAVFPDETITISEVNNPHSGVYNERTLSKEEWQKLNPVFIEVV
jgi:hypothetical protein